MDLTLTRTRFEETGIFGELRDSSGSRVCFTLEHSYLLGSKDPGQGYTYYPKIPEGTYTCKRGPHRLHGMTSDFETFEVQEVPNCTGILVHWGNWNSSSEGCILVGQSIVGDMITHSRVTFAKFMELQDGVDTFQLTVKNS